MERVPDGIADTYWNHYARRSGSREERLQADELSWAWEFVDDAARDAPLGEVLALLDELLAHPEADPGYLGAGPLEDMLNRESIADWEQELAQRCADSALWRQAFHGAYWPDSLDLPRLAPYLRPVAARTPTSPPASKPEQKHRGRCRSRRTG